MQVGEVGHMGSREDFERGSVMFDTNAVSVLQSIFGLSSEPLLGETTSAEDSSKTARVKFMITLQEEISLSGLGYSQAQINMMKPQEAEDILRAGTKAG
jgi:hypothetical protein